MNTNDPDRSEPPFDVAIVGLGPTGATLANLLGQQGLSVLVLERAADVYPLPRAAHYDGETLRIFDSIGLGERVRSISRPGTQGMHFLSGTGQTLLVRAGSDRPGPHGDANNWYFHQPELERTLREGLARFDAVTVRLRHEVLALGQRADRVLISVRDLGHDAPYSIAARYVVGCDGARSMVRRAIDSTSEDLGLHQPWLCLDMLMRREVNLPQYTVQWCDPARPMTMVNMAGQRRRWEIMLMPGDDPETIAQPASVWPLLARWIGPGDAEIERAAVYTFHSVIAHGWRKERLLIAGDAAHQTPPFLGQGMCAGIRDASNLAWKLARVLRSEAPEALLDSYESERLPHVRAFIELAVRVGGVIQATDRELAAERDRRFAESGPEIFSFPAPQLGPGAHAGGEPPVATAFPQPRLDDDRPMDQAIGARFALILRPECMDAIGEPACARLMAGDVRVLAATGGGLRAWLDEHGAQAVLIRPDRYVAGLARQRSDIDALARLLPHV